MYDGSSAIAEAVDFSKISKDLEDLDQQKNAVRKLLNHSGCKADCHAIIAAKVVGPLVRVLGSDDSYVQLMAAKVMANLSHFPESCAAIDAEGGFSVLEELLAKVTAEIEEKKAREILIIGDAELITQNIHFALEKRPAASRVVLPRAEPAVSRPETALPVAAAIAVQRGGPPKRPGPNDCNIV
jgi:hypothetical protein